MTQGSRVAATLGFGSQPRWPLGLTLRNAQLWCCKETTDGKLPANEKVSVLPEPSRQFGARCAPVDTPLHLASNKRRVSSYCRTLGGLKPLVVTPFPVLSHCYFDQLRTDAPVVALWLTKTALTTSFALPGRQRLPETVAEEIARKQAPRGVWIDVAKAKVSGIGAALTKTFPTINGNTFTGPQTHNAGACSPILLSAPHQAGRG